MGVEVGQYGVKLLTFRRTIHPYGGRIATFTFQGWPMRRRYI